MPKASKEQKEALQQESERKAEKPSQGVLVESLANKLMDEVVRRLCDTMNLEALREQIAETLAAEIAPLILQKLTIQTLTESIARLLAEE